MRKKFFQSREREPQRGHQTRRTSTETVLLQVMTLSGCAGKLHICSKKMRHFSISPCPAFHGVQNIHHRRRIRPVGSVPHSVCIGLALIPDHQCDHKSHDYGHPKPVRRRLQGYIKIVHDIPSLTYKTSALRVSRVNICRRRPSNSPATRSCGSQFAVLLHKWKNTADGDFYNSSRNSGSIAGNG